MRRVIIMGAGGRDFHNFNVVFRDDPDVEVVAFTAAQIPGIDDRVYPAALAGALLPERDPGAARGAVAGADRRSRRRRGRVRLLRRAARVRDAPGVRRPRGGCRLHAARPRLDDADEHQARRRRVRGAHRRGQEPDEPARRRDPARGGPSRRPDPPSDALRRSRGDSRPAVRDDRGHRPLEPDDRGARGVRARRPRRSGHVCRRRLRRDPRAGAGRGGRDHLGRWQQRLLVLSAPTC